MRKSITNGAVDRCATFPGRRRRARLALAAALIIPAAQIARATPNVFIGPDPTQVGTNDVYTPYAFDWFDPLNWTQGEPVPGEQVLGYTSTNAITFDLPAYENQANPSSASVDSFSTNSPFEIFDGTLSGDKPNSATTISATGGISVYGGLLDSLTVSSPIQFINSGLTASNVIFNAPVSAAAGGGLTLNGANTLNSSFALISNQISFADNASLTIGSSGSLTGYGYVGYYSNNGGTSLVNNGTISANVPNATLQIYVAGTLASFTNNGIASAVGTGALLNVSTPLNGTGTFTASTSGTIQVNSSWDAGSGAQINAVTGSVNTGSAISGTFNVTGNNFNAGSGNVTDVTINGAVNFPAVSETLAGSNLFNGTVTMSGNSTFTFADNASLTIHSGGLLHGYGYVGYGSNNGGTTFTNNGTISADVTGQTLTIYVPGTIAEFINNGPVTVSQGAGLTVDTNWTNNGAPVTSDGTLLESTYGELTGSGTFTAENSGSITVNGLWTATGPTTVNAVTGSVAANGGLTGTFAVNGNNFSGGGGDLTDSTIDGNVAFPAASMGVFGSNVLNGTATLSGNSTFTFGDNSSLTVHSGGLLHGYGYVGYGGNNGGTIFTNNGTLSADTSGQTLAIYVPGAISQFINNGPVNVTNGATLDVDTPWTNNGASVTSDGTLLASANATITGSGTFTAENGGSITANGLWTATSPTTINAVTGSVAANGGLTGTFGVTGNSFSIGAGILTDVTVNGNVAVSSAGIALFGSNNFNGTTTLTGNSTITFGDNASLTVHSGGLLHGYGYVGYGGNNGGTIFTNNGTLSADTSGQTLAIYVPGAISQFINNGPVNVTNGATLDVDTPWTNNGASVTSDGTLLASANATITGSGTFTAQNGGSITANGLWTATSPTTINAVTGSVAANGGLTGTFGVTGNSFSIGAGILTDVTVNGNVAVSSAGIALFGSNNFNGTTTLTGNSTITFGDNASLTVHSGGLLHGYGYVGYGGNNGGTIFTNNGTLSADTSGQTLAIYVPGAISQFINNGAVTVAAGATLAVDTPWTSTAGTVNIGGTPANPGLLIVNNNATFKQITGGGQWDVNVGTSTLAARSGPSQVGILSVGSLLDLTNNSLFVNYGTSADPVATIAGYLGSGYADGAWTGGSGIVSSTVANLNAAQSRIIYSVGYADGADRIVAGLSSGQIEIMPTLAGDAKLTGNVVFGDFQILAANFGSSAGWDGGNFTYGNIVNFGDFQLLAQNFGDTSAALAGSELASINEFAAQFNEQLIANPTGPGFELVSVPEPASSAIVASVGFALLARRRKRSTSI